MVACRMAMIFQLAEDLRMFVNIVAYTEKGCPGLILTENVQYLRGNVRDGSIVEGNKDFSFSFGQIPDKILAG